MSPPALSAAVARVRGAVSPPADPPTDGQLLTAFVADRDPEAFALLIRRHGPMVLSVCRRVAGHAHDAEDAFQAAFLVLARRAAHVRPAEAVGNWLYGVAVRTARAARASAARRLTREVPTHPLPDVASAEAEPVPADLLAVLDEELARLPDKYRTLLVLCDLEGEPQTDLARRLGLPVGTVYSRLAAARRLLAERLRARGVAPPAAGLAVLGTAAVSPKLLARTAGLASAGPVSPAVVALTNGVFRTMLLQKLKPAATGGLVLAGCLAAWSALPAAPAPELPRPPVFAAQPAPGKKPQPAAKPAGPGTLLAGRTGAVWVLTPDGKKLPELPLPDKTRSRGHVALSPSGTRAAFVVTAEGQPRPPARVGEVPAPWPFKVVVRALDKPAEGKEWDLPAADLAVRWTADGKKLVASRITSREPVGFENVLLDPDTGDTGKLDLPENTRVLDPGRDGRTFLVEWWDRAAKKPQLALAAVGDREARPLAELNGFPGSFHGRLSPDGQAVLFIDGDPGRKDLHKWNVSQRPYLLDVATRKREPLADFPENGQAVGVAWSPDGRRVAYAWAVLREELFKKETISPEELAVETEAFLVVADADGRNPKTIASDKAASAITMILHAIDWR